MKKNKHREYLDMFMFSFHTCGLRMVDVMTLQWKHIDFAKRQLAKILIKTTNYRTKTHIIPLTDSAIEILKRWKEKCGNKRFVFGMLDNDFDLDNRELLYKKRNNIDKCINQSLAVVGDNLKFNTPLTMHVARHTFAVLSINDGMKLSVITRLMGHASTEVTEQAYAKYLPHTLDEELKKLDFSYLAS